MLSNSRQFAPPKDEATRGYLESLIRDDYERCHSGETLDEIKRRAFFSKEDKGLYRDWMGVAVARAEAAHVAGSLLIAAE